MVCHYCLMHYMQVVSTPYLTKLALTLTGYRLPYQLIMKHNLPLMSTKYHSYILASILGTSTIPPNYRNNSCNCLDHCNSYQILKMTLLYW